MPIRILDAQTVGRIAAGEVVERPSSVVKELVENAIDAGATAITVEIRGGGIDSLRVTDNGCGIEPDQVRLAFENHATSKLQSADQLDDIKTLGFRGEALPSIAAVSHVEMTTRARGQETGVRLNIDGGQDLRVREAGCPEGTTFVMRDLFYNLPVRRAFLKKPNYEGGLVADTVARMILGNPGLSIRFINNGQNVYHSFGDNNLRHAVFSVYGRQTAEQMIELDAAEGATRIYGLIGVGELGKPTRAHQAFFINGRAVRCLQLTRALEEVCRTRVTIGLYPMCVLNLVIPAHSVNVNVHPNKLEVRFKDESAMRQTAQQLLSRAFEGEHVLQMAPERKSLQRRSEVKPVKPSDLMAAIDREMEKLRGVEDVALREGIPWTPPRPAPPPPPPPPPREVISPSPAPRVQQELAVESSPKAPTAFKIIGVLMKTYILAEADDSLVMIDQHAAHERLNYEKLLKQVEAGQGAQQLLTPLILHLSAREMALVTDNLDTFREAGYEVEPFGERDIQVRSVPMILGQAQLRPAFMDALGALEQVKSAGLDQRRAEIMQMACKSAVKGGDVLSTSEVESLIEQMLSTGAPPTCPHGRPVMKTITRRELEKMFKRIQ